MYEYIPYQMSLKSLGKVDQELQIQGRYVSILLTKCLLKASEKVDRELQGGYTSIFPTRSLLKA